MNHPSSFPHRLTMLRSVRKLYRTFGPHLNTRRKWFLLAYACLTCALLMNLAKPWPLKLIFDYILFDKQIPHHLTYFSSLLATDKLTLLTIFCISIVAVHLLEGLFSYSNKYFIGSVGESMMNDIRRRVFGHLQTLPQSFHGSSNSGDLVVRLTSDINALKKLLISHVQAFATFLFSFMSISLTMLWMDWELALVALAVVPGLYLIAFGFSGKVERLTKIKRTKEGEVAAIVQETLTSMAIVQAFSQEGQERKRFAKESGESVKAGVEKMRLARGFGRAVQVIIAIGTALVAWYGARRVLAGEVTPGDLIVFTAYLKDLYSPIGKLSELLMDFTSALVCGERIAEVLDAEITVTDAPGAVKASPFRGEVAFEQVTFGYRHGEPVLQDVSFAVKPGQLVALVGSSGTGKSTVVNLLLRFYDPWEGRIIIDSEDIRRFTLKSLRRQMSVVFQESILFRRTIRENIAYGKPKASFQEIVAASKAAQAHEFIEKLPRSYETILDERGESLSGGQRQRIALARAVLKDAPILILDEPVSSLDAITGARVNETLIRLTQGKTTFMIAHRLATMKNADLILVIEEGKVIEQGTHAELLANSSVYRHFYNLQCEQYDSRYEQCKSADRQGGDP